MPTVSQQFTNIIKSIIIAFGDSGETIENFGGNSSTGLSSRMIQLSGISWMLIHNAVFGLGASCHTRGKLSYRINGVWQVRDTIDNGYVGYFVEEGLLVELHVLAYSTRFLNLLGKKQHSKIQET